MASILVLNGSSRARGFTAAMIRSFAQGARQAGNTVQVLDLRDLDIHCCVGCLHGGADPAHPCTQRDDMATVYAAYRACDVVVLATPLFFWSYSGLLKNAFDRLWALAECQPDELHGNGRSGALLVAAGGSHPAQLLAHFDYLMLRMGWRNLGSAVLLHTDDLDPAAVTDVPQARELGASIA